MITAADLEPVAIFEGLSSAELEWLAERMEELELAAGEPLHRPESPAVWLYVVLEGTVRGTIRDGERTIGSFLLEAGEVGGMLPKSRMERFPPSTAVERSRVARLHRDHFPEMLERIPELEERLAHLMSDRIREGARATLQQEKLASLGTMAAGLAHELNNPAAAARRAARSLGETLERFDRAAAELLAEVVIEDATPGEDPFEPLYERLAAPARRLDAITRGEREDALSEWLEEVGVEQGWELAPALVAAGFEVDFLRRFAERVVPDRLERFVTWVARDAEMRQLADELQESTRRISELIDAMRAYSFSGRSGERAEVDLNRGLVDTLTILGHKLRRKGVEVERRLGELPPIEAYGGELNQVWTNLLDNALAAVPDEGGRIVVESRHEPGDEMVQVEIRDNGPGIAEEHMSRIFEPFFTTKGVGEGTGLGLDIVYRIVKARHGGTVEACRDGDQTVFRVRLPLADPGADNGAAQGEKKHG